MSRIGREILMFRTDVDPMIGPKPRQAFVPRDMGMHAEFWEEGVHVTVLKDNTEFLVPWGHVQCIRLAAQEETKETAEIKPRMGRPPKSGAV